MAHGMSFAPESWSEEDRELWERPLDAPGPKSKFDLEQTILDRKLFNVVRLCLEDGLNLTFEHCCFNERTGIDTLEFLGGFSRSFKGFYGPVWFGGSLHTSFCPADVLDEAIKRGFQTTSLVDAGARSDAWKALLRHERFDVAEALLTHGLLDLQSCPPERVTQEMLDWAAMHGFVVQCKAPSLLLASGKAVGWRGVKEELHGALSSNRPLAPINLPSFDCACDQRAIGQAESLFLSSYAPPGMWGVCDTLDAELIEAYLAAGYVDDVDPSAAIEAGRDDILELYRRYGASCKPKRIIEGSRYIKKWRARQQSGEIRIPRGVEMVSEGASEIGPLACRGTQARGIVLPNSLEVIYQGAFLGASGWLVHIPAGVRHIAPGAFCPSWKQEVDASWRPCYFRVDSANERFLALDGSLVERDGDGLRLLSLYFDDPMGEVLNWRNAFYRVPEGVTRLGRFSIAGQKDWCLRHLVLPHSLRYVESGFSHTNSFESGNLPAGVVFEEGEEGFYEFACRFDPAPGKKPKIEGIADLEARYPWLVTKGTLPPEAGEERRQLAYFINLSENAVCLALRKRSA